MAISRLRWLTLAIGLLLLAFSVWAGQDAIDEALRGVCPAGWWHVGAGGLWAHCAFPPMSIAKYAGTYTLASLLALVYVYFVAPKAKLIACCTLLAVSIGGPLLWLASHGFSWTALAALLGVGALALVFALGAQSMHHRAQEKIQEAL